MQWGVVFERVAPRLQTYLSAAEWNKLSLLDRSTKQRARESLAPTPFVADVVYTTQQSVAVWAERLLDPKFIHDEIETIQTETDLYQQLDHLSYPAADAIRRRIAHHLPSLPPHASQRDVAVAVKEAANSEVNAWLQWYERYADHVAFGRVCLSVDCTAHHFCAAARLRTPPVPLLQQKEEPPPACLPSTLWSLVLDYIPSHDLDTQAKLGKLHPFFVFKIKQSGVWPVLRHHMTWMKLDKLMVARLEKREAANMTWQAPCSVVYDTFTHLLRDLHQAYSTYSAKFSDMRYKQMQYPPEEKHICITEFLHMAETFALESRGAGDQKQDWSERLLRALRQLDFRLLDTYAFDVMTLHNTVVTSLPLRAFHEGSKHRKAFRKEFTDPTPHSPHRGAQVQHALMCMREELRYGRRDILTRLRHLEAFFVAPLQRLVEELHDMCLIPSSWMHVCASLAASCNTTLPHAVLNGLTQELVDTAEKVPTLRSCGALGEKRRDDAWQEVARVVGMMQRALVALIQPSFSQTLGDALQHCVTPFVPLNNLYQMIVGCNIAELHLMTREYPFPHGIQLKLLRGTVTPFVWDGMILSRYCPRLRRTAPLCLLILNQTSWSCLKLDAFEEQLLDDLVECERTPEEAVNRHLELLRTHGRLTHVEKAQNAALLRYLERN